MVCIAWPFPAPKQNAEKGEKNKTETGYRTDLHKNGTPPKTHVDPTF